MSKNQSKYDPKYAKQAAELALLGATDKMLAVVFGVHVDTITNWKASHPTFGRALDLAYIKANKKVAESLYDMAVGYEYEVDVEKLVEEKGEKKLKKISVRRFSPPSAQAAMFWLKSREPELWREMSEVKHTGLDELLAEIQNTSRGLPSAHPAAKNYRAKTH